jgi:ribosome-associated protein
METRDNNDDDKGSGRYIELNAFICLNRLATTGGRAKLLIKSGNVSVNEKKETRNKRKLHANDIISYMGKNYVVKAEVCRMK